MKSVSIADQASAASCYIHILRVYNICSYTVQECTVYIFAVTGRAAPGVSPPLQRPPRGGCQRHNAKARPLHGSFQSPLIAAALRGTRRVTHNLTAVSEEGGILYQVLRLCRCFQGIAPSPKMYTLHT